MPDPRPVVVTGASGFLGRRLVERLRRDRRVIAIDRRPRDEAELDDHPNLEWFHIDLADPAAVADAFGAIQRRGGAEFLVHLAAYYDFTGEEHPEYRRTNVEATRLVLENSAGLGLKRFVFASSVAACDFSRPGRPIDETTPPEGRHVYARTKMEGERLLRVFAERVPSCSVRFAAMFSDWCEYPPLYVFLDTWLSERWNARILGGKGNASIPFLHVRDGVGFVLRVFERADSLEPCEVVIASVDGAVSHRELFEAATAHRFGAAVEPIGVPRALAWAGMWGRDLLTRLEGVRPFERPWMAAYIDKRMEVDAARTRRRLGWAPNPRLHVLHRVPFMIENMRANPMEWFRRNREALEHHEMRPTDRVYRLVEKHEAEIARAFAAVLRRQARDGMDRYRSLSVDDREWTQRMLIRSLLRAIRTGEKAAFMEYCRDAAERRRRQGFRADEVVEALRTFDRVCLETLRADPEAAGLDRALQDLVSAAIAFGIDQVHETYEEA